MSTVNSPAVHDLTATRRLISGTTAVCFCQPISLRTGFSRIDRHSTLLLAHTYLAGALPGASALMGLAADHKGRAYVVEQCHCTSAVVKRRVLSSKRWHDGTIFASRS